MTSKGKEKDSDGRDDDRPTPEDQQPPDTLPARVLNSASGLLRDAFSSSVGQASDTLSNALAAGGKAEASSSTSSTEGAAAYKGKSVAGSTTVNKEGSAGGMSGSFRSFPNFTAEAFDGMSLDQFLEYDPEINEPLSDEEGQSRKGKEVADRDGNFAGVDYFDAVWRSTITGKESQAPTQGSQADGQEVVRLLSDPNFQPDIWSELDVGVERPYTISAKDMALSRLFMKETSKYDRQLANAVQAASQGRPFDQFASFFDEIENYHEDVWGYMQPLVEAAREENRQGRAAEGPAVRRLRMILAHIQPEPATLTSEQSQTRNL